MKSEHTPPIGAPLPQAIELVVNSGGDVVDPGDGVLTLREAIADQQQAAGVSARITFATGVNAVELTQGELFIGGGPTTADAATLTIDGGTGVTISQSGPSTDHNGRVLHIDGTSGAAPQLALDNLVFTGGSVQSYNPSQPSQIGYGGGLLAENTTVALTDVTVRGNRVDLVYGGKLGGGGVALVGCTTTITGGSIEDNTVAGPSGAVAVGGLGGGILAVNGSLTLSGTTVSGNSCTSIGGAAGGGIGLNGTDTTLDHVTVERNTAGSVNNPSGYNNFGSHGGGVAAFGGSDLTVSYSTVGANYVYGPGASGGGISAGGRLTVEHSLLTDNHAKSPSLALGGGIYMSGGALALSDSTVEGNKLYTAGQGSGGGINVRNGSASIISATIVGNTGSTSSTGSTGAYGTGGVDLSEAAGATPIHNSIIAGNTGDVADVRGYIASDGHNLFSSRAASTASSRATSSPAVPASPLWPPMAGRPRRWRCGQAARRSTPDWMATPSPPPTSAAPGSSGSAARTPTSARSRRSRPAGSSGCSRRATTRSTCGGSISSSCRAPSARKRSPATTRFISRRRRTAASCSAPARATTW